jgi:transposase
VPGGIPEALKPALEPILQTIGELTARIREYDRKLAALAEELYPETKLLEQVQGVGPLTALAFVLIVEDPARFANGRAVGAYAGLVPGKDQSGGSDPQRRISRHGNELLRRLLVGCAHYTSSARSVKTPTLGATGRRSPSAAARTPGRGR